MVGPGELDKRAQRGPNRPRPDDSARLLAPLLEAIPEALPETESTHSHRNAHPANENRGEHERNLGEGEGEPVKLGGGEASESVVQLQHLAASMASFASPRIHQMRASPASGSAHQNPNRSLRARPTRVPTAM